VAESHEPSYYEIALTNSQVMVAFAILLICLLGAFFSGVWIGRESTARNNQEQMVRNTPPEVAPEGKNLEELEFFDKNKKAADDKKRREAAAAPLGTTLLEDLGVKKKKPEARTPPPAADPVAPAAEEPATEPAPRQARPAPAPVDAAAIDPAQERRNRRKARAAEAAAAAAETAKAPAPAATAKTSAPANATKAPKGTKAAAAPAVPKGSFVIQVFSSADQAQAERIRGKLAGGGQKAYLSPINRGGRTMYRVRVGPFRSHDEAQKVADKVRKGYKLDTWVTE
jgi:cell division septation protein DedD